MEREHIHVPITLAFTKDYFVPAATCITSILQHSTASDRFHFICLLSEDLSPSMQLMLEQLGAGKAQFSFLNLADYLNDIYVDKRYTVAASYRLLLPDLLPEYKQVIYIDCDVIVRSNLAAFYRENTLGSEFMAAVYEVALDFQYAYIKSLGCRPGYYFNSGFLLMNLQQLRAEGMVARFLEASKQDGLQFPDQDVLNQLCQGRIKAIAPFYNSIRTYFLPQYKELFLRRYSLADWQAVQDYGTIHYTGSKPWNSFTVQFDVWWNYFETLPAAIQRLHKGNTKYYLLARIYRTGPGKKMFAVLQTLYRKLKYQK